MSGLRSRSPLTWLLLAITLLGLWLGWPRPAAHPTSAAQTVAATPSPSAAAASAAHLPAFLPPEAVAAIRLIQRGGPFPYPQDGRSFGNREGLLPSQPRGWYREYTVETPGLSHRGKRRLITGGDPPQEWYYTDDHYRSFRRFAITRE